MKTKPHQKGKIYRGCYV